MWYKMFVAEQMLRAGSKKAADTASKAVQDAKALYDSKKQQKEDTERLVQEYQQMLQQAAQEDYACRQLLEHEYRYFESLVQDLEKTLFSAYQGICEYADAEYIACHGDVQQLELPSRQMSLLSDGDFAMLKALGVGVSTGVGVAGLTAALGTAGTGAAISSLHGAAFMSALLAKLGGGTLAAGGLGIAGGMAALVGLVALPASAALVYQLNKKLDSSYQNALENHRKAQDILQQVETGKAMVENISRDLRQLSLAISSFSQFFHDMLNMGAVSMGMGRTQEFQPLLNDGAAVLWGYMGLSPVKDDVYNEAFSKELTELNKLAEKCRHGFYEYFMHLSPQEQSSMENSRQDDFVIRLQQAESELKVSFGTGWKHLENSSRRSLTTGMAVYQQLAATRQHLDYAGVCTMVSSVLEKELKRRLFQDFCRYVEDKYPFATNAGHWPAFLCRWQNGCPVEIIPDKQITLGSIPYLCNVKQKTGMNPEKMALNMRWLSAYGRERLFRSALSDDEVKGLFDFIGRFAQYVADTWRNNAAHQGNVGYTRARDCLAFVLEGKQSFPWLMAQFKG